MSWNSTTLKAEVERIDETFVTLSGVVDFSQFLFEAFDASKLTFCL